MIMAVGNKVTLTFKLKTLFRGGDGKRWLYPGLFYNYQGFRVDDVHR